jgi:hypothetical protein
METPALLVDDTDTFSQWCASRCSALEASGRDIVFRWRME